MLKFRGCCVQSLCKNIFKVEIFWCWFSFLSFLPTPSKFFKGIHPTHALRKEALLSGLVNPLAFCSTAVGGIRQFSTNGRRSVISTNFSFLLPTLDFHLMPFLRVPCPPGVAFWRDQWAAPCWEEGRKVLLHWWNDLPLVENPTHCE